MKRFILLVFSLLLTFTVVMSQDGINYQGAATDGNGDELTNQNITIRASVLSTSASGNLEWEETHSATTDQFGLFNVVIGQGTNTTNGATANFDDMDWGSGNHFLKIEMDATGGTNYAMIGTTQMMSVPYALYAKSSGSTSNQTLSVSVDGDTLFISDGNFVLVPGISNTNYPTVPIVNFTASSTNITEGGVILFTDNSTNNPTSWLWDFGDGGTSIMQNPTYTYLNDGVYTVTLTASNTIGSATDSIVNYITVNDISTPQFADFIANQTNINTNDTITFTDISTNNPTSWSWDFGDGNSSSLQNPTNIYLNSGIYTVSLIAGGDTAIRNNYIYVSGVAIQPVADFIADDTIKLENEIIQFTDLSINNPVIWTWNFGDGNTSPLQNPTHNYSTTGDYTVSLTATNMYGGNTIVKTNYMHIGLVPIATFTANDTSIIANDTVSFTDISANAPTSWFWDFGDGNTSTVQNPTHVYTVTGSYDVTLIATNMFGSDTLVSQSFIDVFLPPIAAFYASQTTVAGGDTVHFTDQSLNNPTSWLWDFGDGFISTQQNPTHHYTTQGVYTITLVVISGFGTSSTSSNITVTTTNLQIGDYHEGGIIFYLDSLGGGMVVALNDAIWFDGTGQSVWGCNGNFGTGYNIGTDSLNTYLININSSNCIPNAAHLCLGSSQNGKTDWVLPSQGTLILIESNKNLINNILSSMNGASPFSGMYWSSSEYPNGNVWGHYLANGSASGSCCYVLLRNGINYTRGIRIF